MKLIVGLGNPGKEYENTRHNVGFLALENLKNKTQGKKLQPKAQNFKYDKKFNAEILNSEYGNKKIILIKPQTFMNNSGVAVKKTMGYYKIGIDDLWVVCDDLDLELGQIRIRQEGSSGGHRGLQSIIDQIGNNRFVRFRVGIRSNQPTTDNKQLTTNSWFPAEKYVLQKFAKDERAGINKAIDKTVELIVELLQRGIIEQTVNINIV